VANQRKTEIEIPLGGAAEAGTAEDEQKVRDAVASASAKFFEEISNAGLESAAEAGEGHDKMSCGHDRTPR
jgi:hypothetical protein